MVDLESGLMVTIPPQGGEQGSNPQGQVEILHPDFSSLSSHKLPEKTQSKDSLKKAITPFVGNNDGAAMKQVVNNSELFQGDKKASTPAQALNTAKPGGSTFTSYTFATNSPLSGVADSMSLSFQLLQEEWKSKLAKASIKQTTPSAVEPSG
jgi:hypothetical protein